MQHTIPEQHISIFKTFLISSIQNELQVVSKISFPRFCVDMAQSDLFPVQSMFLILH